MSAAARVQKWVWILIYAGLALLGLGLAAQRGDASVGWPIALVGVALIAAGALLIWIRSRMNIDNP